MISCYCQVKHSGNLATFWRMD